MVRLTTFSWALSIASLMLWEPVLAQTRLALVIGNGAYESGPLSSPIKDEQQVSKKLKDLGFQVSEKSDLNRQEMLAVIGDFGETIGQNPNAIRLFYYSGHGMTINNRNYVIPIDANIKTEADVELYAVPVENVLLRMTMSKGVANILILDACRDNPFEKRWKSSSGGLAPMINAPTGTLIAYAAAPGHVAEAGLKGNLSKYTEALVSLLDQPSVNLITTFQDVQNAVLESTEGRQRPYLEISPGLPRDFSFNIRPSPAVALTPSELVAQATAAAGKKDHAEAARLYKLAADQGDAWAQAELGTFYRDGRGGLPKDDREAARLYKLAADQGDGWAQAALGTFYRDGRGGLPKDDREAARLYKLAADQGDAWAQAALGTFYRNGRGGLPKDDREAARLYKLAADQGDAYAQAILGLFHEKGQGGFSKNDREAARLFKLAADQGEAWAQAELGMFYEYGRGGLPKDDREAARLYELAANQGNAWAQAALKRLTSSR